MGGLAVLAISVAEGPKVLPGACTVGLAVDALEG
jgi:hypothetical protein